MTQDEIIRTAREVGFYGLPVDERLERFAALVAEATLEKAAKVCEEQKQEWKASVYRNGAIAAIGGCAAAIRSMK